MGAFFFRQLCCFLFSTHPGPHTSHRFLSLYLIIEHVLGQKILFVLICGCTFSGLLLTFFPLSQGPSYISSAIWTVSISSFQLHQNLSLYSSSSTFKISRGLLISRILYPFSMFTELYFLILSRFTMCLKFQLVSTVTLKKVATAICKASI